MNIDENEQLLSLPIVIDDLVRYRLTDVVIANLKSYLIFFFPCFLLLYSAMGWSVGWVLLIAILSIVLALISYLCGIWLMLLIAKKLPNVSIIKLCINIFIVIALLFAGFLTLFKRGYIVEGQTSLWMWIGKILATNSISVWIENMVVRSFGFLQYMLVLTVCGILIFYLWKIASKALYVMYYKIHVSTDITTIKTKMIASGVSFEKLNSLLHFIPSFPRIIIIKDTLALIRKPNLAISVVIFVGGLILLTNMKFASVDNPLLFALYYASMFVVSRLFLGAVGKERNNIINIKLLVPSVAKYLSARIQITILTSFVVLFPLWIVLIIASGDYSILFDFYSLMFLILNIVFGSILVTYFSASFAEFVASVSEDSYTGITPMAMLLYWGVGFIVPVFFYNLDIAMSSGGFDFISLIIISTSGLIILISILLCYYFGIRRIRNYF
jgi:hypothetical protein